MVLGGLVVLAGLVDVFLTVLHFDEPGLIAARTYRVAWRTARALTGPLPGRLRSLVRSMAAPLMVAGTLGGWLGAQVFGFALIYLPAVADRHDFDFGTLPRNLGSSLYFSAASLTSLSFSDAEPRRLAYHWVAAIETLIGLGILTLAISYLLGLYQVLQQQGVLASRLRHQARGENDPRSLLSAHFVDGEAREISTLLRDLHQNLTEQHEGMRRYPIAYYFHSRELSRSLPYIFWFIGASAASLRWGLPSGHPATRDPYLPTLLDGFDDVLGRFRRRFLPRTASSEWHPVSEPRFAEDLRRGRSEEERLQAFIEVEAFMGEIAGVQPWADPADSYTRYVEWGTYTSRGKAFVEAASRDLGLDPARLYDEPSARMF